MSWIAAGVSIGGALLGANSANRAADEISGSSDAAAAESRRQFDLVRGDTANARNIGNQALNSLGGIYGYSPAQPQTTAGNSPIQSQDFQAIAGLWPTIRSAARFEDINWAAHGFPNGPPVSPETQAMLSQQWGVIRNAANLSDVNWQAQGFGPESGQPATGQPGQPGQPAQPPATAPDYSNFFASPDYNFRRTEGTRGIENSFAARGGAASGNALRALTEFSSGLAAGEFGNYFNRQASLAGIGQTGTAQSAAAGANSAANVGNALLAGGDARASGILGQGAALAGGASDVASNFLYRGAPRRRQPSGGPNPWL